MGLVICNHCGAEGQIRAEREHPEDPLVLKCYACSRYAGPQRAHEEPMKDAYRWFIGESRHGIAMTYKEGCRCEPCVKAYRNAELRRKKRREARKAAA